MIPKVIHYCWFGRNPLPPSALKSIASWKKYLPDYEIKEWNEDNFDVNIIPYTTEAYAAKKYAFVSDYARFWILYNFGGVYFDTDVEVIKPMDSIIAQGPFMGREVSFDICNARNTTIGVNPGLGIGAIIGMDIYRKILEHYKNEHFSYHSSANGPKTIVDYTSEVLVAEGLINSQEIMKVAGIKIYPSDYFCPINYITRKLEITSNTVSIHWYDATWMDTSFLKRLKRRIQKHIPSSVLMMWNKMKSHATAGNHNNSTIS